MKNQNNISNKKLVLLIFALSLITPSFLFATVEYFGMSRPDISQYPEVRASFTASQANGQYFSNLKPSDFIIKENGERIPTSLIKVECEEQIPVDLLLVLDNSTSMGDEVDGKQKWDWVQESVTEFIESVQMPDSSTIGIMIFNANPKMVCDFTDDKEVLQTTFNTLQPVMGPTDFNNCFLVPNTGVIDVLRNRSYDRKRIAIMLSDGNHTPERGAFKQDEIIQGLITNNITCFTITYLEENQSSELQSIANRTGGEYEHVVSATQLDDIYSMIADVLFQKPLCFVSWISAISCDQIESFRNLEASFIQVEASSIEYQYVAPEWSIFRMNTDKQIYDFGNPEPTYSEYSDIVLSPDLNVEITDFILSGEEWFEIVDYGKGSPVKPKSLKINAGEEKTLRIKFTQGAEKDPRFGILYLEATPCPLEIPLRAGYEDLVITKPSTGDIYTSCANISVDWQGVPEDKNITLEYSIDSAKTWNMINNAVSGRTYTWNVNSLALDSTTHVLIRGKATYSQEYQWLIGDGGASNETVKTLTGQENELFVTVCGEFDANTSIAEHSCKYEGENDWYIARYDVEGNNQWVLTGTSEFDNNIVGALTDPLGDVYIACQVINNMTIGGAEIVFTKPDIRYTFIAKISKFGNLIGYSSFENPTFDMPFESWPTAIGMRFDGVNEARIVIQGRYIGQYKDNLEGLYLPESNWANRYTLEYSTDLKLQRLYDATETWGATFPSSIVTFPSGTRYEADSYTGTKEITQGNRTFTINSNGGSDLWISKQAKQANNVDISDAFKIIVPELGLIYNNFDKNQVPSFDPSMMEVGYIFCDTIRVGTPTNRILPAMIYNNSETPIKIVEGIITGENPECFSLHIGDEGLTIEAGDTIGIVITFTPNKTRKCFADLEIDLDCGESLLFELEGFGYCQAITADTLDFGKQIAGFATTQTFTATFLNPMSIPITIRPVLKSDAAHKDDEDNFTLISPVQYENLDVYPGVPLDFTIEYTPSGIGTQECYIEYNVNNCDVPPTIIMGEGGAGKMAANNLLWGRHRMNTSFADKTINLINLGNMAKTIDQLDYDLSLASIFIWDADILPITVEPLDTFRIPIQFKPTETIYYEDEITFYSTENDTIKVKLTGTAFLPEYSYTQDCAGEINIGETGEAYIEITNTSGSSDLTIDEIILDNIDEFTWLSVMPDGTYSNQFILPLDSTIRFNLDYTPTVDGLHYTQVHVFADDFDGAFPDEWKETTINISCDALSIEVTDPDDGVSSLLCDDSSFRIEVENTSQSTLFTCLMSNASISGSSKDYFSFENTDDIDIAGGETGYIDVSFSSDIEGQHNATVTIPTTAGIDIVSTITTEVVAAILTTTEKKTELLPGEKSKIDFIIDIPNTSKGNISKIDVDIRQANSGLVFDLDSFKPIENAITWDEPTLTSENEINITGVGILDLPYNEKLFSLSYTAMLDDAESTEIWYDINYECTDREFNVHLLEIADFCLSNSRNVIIGDTAFATTIKPNPANETFQLDFNVSFDETNVSVELYNMSGKNCGTLLNKQMNKGLYELTFSTNGVENGVYIMRYKAGYYTRDMKIIISK